MPDIRILLVIAVAVIGFPLFIVLFFGHFYRREVRIKTLSSKSVEGVVVGYKRAQIVAAPIVEYIVDGQTYRNSLKYYWVVRATLPWKTNQAASDIDLMAQRITIYTNSTVSKGNLFQDAFPLGLTMMRPLKLAGVMMGNLFTKIKWSSIVYRIILSYRPNQRLSCCFL